MGCAEHVHYGSKLSYRVAAFDSAGYLFEAAATAAIFASSLRTRSTVTGICGTVRRPAAFDSAGYLFAPAVFQRQRSINLRPTERQPFLLLDWEPRRSSRSRLASNSTTPTPLPSATATATATLHFYGDS